MIARRILCLACVLPLLAAACKKPQVESYRVPKEKDPAFPAATADAGAPASAGASPGTAPAGATGTVAAAAPTMPAPAAPGAPAGGNMAATPVTTAQGAGLAWTPPAHWKTKAASAMRKGSYAVPGKGGADGDLSITAFPNDVGGELANINRWRGQVQLPPIAAADLPAAVQRREHDGLTFAIVDLTAPGANPQRILAAIVPFNGATWFFKLIGPDALVAAEKPAFLAFLDSVKPSAN